jgi:DNA-binding CsgD family transcriptional regulator
MPLRIAGFSRPAKVPASCHGTTARDRRGEHQGLPFMTYRATALIGRDKELEILARFLEQAAAEGGAFLLVGEPGAGKTALLDAAADAAEEAGTEVLRAAGVQFEADLTYSGLHQVLLPVFGQFERLSAAHRDALNVALGYGEGPPPDRLLVSTATLTVLLQAAADRPVLMVVDDLPWLDRASAGVLGFVARRLASSRVGFLSALRRGEESFFERAGLPQYELGPLDEQAANALVSICFPELAPLVRRRVVTEAQGNPLALLELPAMLSGAQRAAAEALPVVLPLSRRLQVLFASRASDLPAPARRLLLLAVLEGSGDVRLLHAAAGHHDIDDLAPAEQAGLVRVSEGTGRLVFCHPLTRSAIVDLATSGDRRRAHRALADQLADQPERQAWHLAAATPGPDEKVAGLLEEAAHRTLRKGDAVGAVAGLLRAADLSPLRSDQSRRLADAAYVGADVTGDLRSVSQLLAAARRADPEPSESLSAAVAASYFLLNGDGDVDAAPRLLAGAIEDYPGERDPGQETLPEALNTLLMVCMFGGRAELWEPFHAAIARLTPNGAQLLSLASRTLSDPVRMAAPVLGQLDAVIAGLNLETDPTRIVRIGIAAFYIDRLAACRNALWRVVHDGRAGGAVASAVQALIMLSYHDIQSGDWEEAHMLAEEALEFCAARGYQLFAWPARYCHALLAAARGDYDTTSALTDEMIAWATPRGVQAAWHYACHARGLAALGQGAYEDAYRSATAISPAGVLASHIQPALWVPMDLVEAAVRTGRHAEAAAHVTAMRDARIAILSPRLALLATASEAIIAPGDLAPGLFDKALAIPGADRFPFDLARVRLCYGERLRRARAITGSRAQLTAALETFERLGARPWAARAASQLRAAGRTDPRADLRERDLLTPQEREIAMLAAAGLSNKEIGQQLFMSHRTVGAHLYQIFPKLGITSRAALRDALADLPEPDHQDPAPGPTALRYWRVVRPNQRLVRPSSRMPSRAATAWEGTLSGSVSASTWSIPAWAAVVRRASAASVASPWP